MNENFKKSLDKFINAVVNKDDVAAKTAFSTYSQDKAKELHSPKPTTLSEMFKILNEDLDLGYGFVYSSSSIFLDGKHIGTMEMIGDDEVGKGNTYSYLDDDGERFTLKDNTFPPLVAFLRKKYHGVTEE